METKSKVKDLKVDDVFEQWDDKIPVSIRVLEIVKRTKTKTEMRVITCGGDKVITMLNSQKVKLLEDTPSKKEDKMPVPRHTGRTTFNNIGID